MATHEDLAAARGEIDDINQMIIGQAAGLLEYLRARNEAVDRVNNIKVELGLEPLQPQRFLEMMEEVRALGFAEGLAPGLVDTIFNALHEDSVKRQAAQRHT